MDDIRNFFRDTIGVFIEQGLKAELEDELGYAKQDVANKQTKK